jgi:hypothetical protein
MSIENVEGIDICLPLANFFDQMEVGHEATGS